MARKILGDKPIGATDSSPLVVLTSDIARFLRGHIETGANGNPIFGKIVSQIKTCKEQGQVLSGVSYDVLKRIYREDLNVTADNIAEAILISQAATDNLGKDIPLYRNPFFSEEKYCEVMRQRLRKGWDVKIDGPWDEEEQLEYIKSFPSITPP